MHSDTKTIIVVLLLVTVFPIGVIMMWIWMKWWPKWVKLLITIPFLILPLIGVIAAMTLIAVNPSEKFAEARDTQRSSDLNAYINAIQQYKNETGAFPAGISNFDMEISKSGADICLDLVPNHMAGLATDPDTESGTITDCDQPYSTGYHVRLNEDERITLSAPNTEGETTIEVTR
jgi:type II secretory pathway pseudopilin PulG